mgnify:CR=1 FL=1
MFFMKKLRILFFIVVILLSFCVAIIQVNDNTKKVIQESVSEFLPQSTFISSEKGDTITTFNYQYKDIPFTVYRAATVVTEAEGSFETIDIETNYLHNLFQYKRDLLFDLADNYGIGLYGSAQDFISNIHGVNRPMVYYDLRSDICYLYCFISTMDDINTLFDFFGSVMVGIEDYLPKKANENCKSEILVNIIDMRDIKESDIVQSKEFYMELLFLTEGSDIESYRSQASNVYFKHMEDSVFQLGVLDEFLKS